MDFPRKIPTKTPKFKTGDLRPLLGTVLPFRPLVMTHCPVPSSATYVSPPPPPWQASALLNHRFHTMPWLDYYAAAFHIPMSEVWAFQATFMYPSPGGSSDSNRSGNLLVPPDPAMPLAVSRHPTPAPSGRPSVASESRRSSQLGHTRSTTPAGSWPTAAYAPAAGVWPAAPLAPGDIYLAPHNSGSHPGSRRPSSGRPSLSRDETAVLSWQQGVTEVVKRRNYMFGAWIFIRYHNSQTPPQIEGLQFGKRWAKFYATGGAECVTGEDFEQVWIPPTTPPVPRTRDSVIRNPLARWYMSHITCGGGHPPSSIILERLCEKRAGAGVGGTPRGRSCTREQRDKGPTLTC